MDETKNQFPEEELETLTKELFTIKENDLYASLIISIFQGNLSLILLFSKYCLSAGVKFTNQNELFNYYEKFKEDYQKSCLTAHYDWLQKKDFLQNQNPIKQCVDLMNFLDLDMKPKILYSRYLDLRYVYCDGLRIHSMNVFVKEVLQKLYWTEELIETFINQFHSSLSGSAFGWLFDVYMLMKLKKFASNDDILKIQTTDNETISLNIGNFSELYYGKNPKIINPQKQSSEQSSIELIQQQGSGRDYLTFRPSKSNNKNRNTLFFTPQENFPFTDVVYHEPSTKTAVWINWKTNPNDLDKFLKEKKSYFVNYPKKATEQLSILNFISFI